jgi:hypothetical protein
MEAVLDTMTKWRREKYPENEHHATCLFTCESIAANSNNFEGIVLNMVGSPSMRIRNLFAKISTVFDIGKRDIYTWRVAVRP